MVDTCTGARVPVGGFYSIHTCTWCGRVAIITEVQVLSAGTKTKLSLQVLVSGISEKMGRMLSRYY